MSPRVLLIRPLCEGEEPEFAEPLGIERLAGYLRAHGVPEVLVLDRRLYQQEQRSGCVQRGFWNEVRQQCAEGAPSLVGLSLMTAADVPDALRIMSRARAWWPEARIVAGGLYVTTSPKEAAVRLPKGVTLLSGEGEEALLALAQDSTAEPSTAPGATLSPNDWAPAYRPYLERYAALGCSVNMQTSRGCPGACAFCATPLLPRSLRLWQPRDLCLVVDEIAHEAARFEAAGLPAIFNFVDDDFGPLERIEALADELRVRGLRIAFALEMRAASLIGQPDLAARLRRLHDAGLTRVFVGVESLSDQTLRRWHKPYDVAALPEVVGACEAAGISLQPGYILWHADQTIADARAEVQGLQELGIYSHRAALSRLIVFEGCALARTGSAGSGPDAWGLQPLSPEAEAFYQRFSEATRELMPAWLQAAIAEPYAAAEAHLTGSTSRISQIHRTLSEVNARSFSLFMEMSS